MREYMINSMDTVLRGSPDCGVILTGDFNQFKNTFYVHIMVTSSLLRLPHVILQYWTKCGLTCHPYMASRQ